MISFLRRYRQGLIISVFIIFMIGIFVGLGGYFFTGADNSEAVASVGKTKIPYMAYRVRVNQYLDAMRSKNAEVTEAMQAEVKQGMLRDMIVEELLASAGEKLGLRVSDTEVSYTIQSMPAFQREGRFDQTLYFQSVRYGLKSSPEKFEAEQRRSLLASKVKTLIFRATQILPGELKDEYMRRHNGSDKDFEKNKAAFYNELRQARAIDAVNFFLKQMTSQVEIRSYLDERERGL